MMKFLRSLLFWEGLSFAVAFLGSSAMDESSMMWYSGLARSALTPPNIAFPIVWSFLYALMGYSAFRIARKAKFRALIPYIVQLSVNLVWSWAFFYFRQPSSALAILFLLLCSLLWTVAEFNRHDRLAAALLVPYVLWGAFAFWLNLYVVIHN
ncbi:MAG: tryptophan-rich sensory protein [Synergistaceae bacterium]|nr:tryptophan-rich sensory protein [Synergistaceae bacterium]